LFLAFLTEHFVKLRAARLAYILNERIVLSIRVLFIYLFIYDVFEDTVGSPCYISSSDPLIEGRMQQERSWPDLKLFLAL